MTRREYPVQNDQIKHAISIVFGATRMAGIPDEILAAACQVIVLTMQKRGISVKVSMNGGEDSE